MTTYPFDLEKYKKDNIEYYSEFFAEKYSEKYASIKMTKLLSKLKTEMGEYYDFMSKLLRKLSIHFDYQVIKINKDTPYSQMERNALSNFIYELNLKGYFVKVNEYIDDTHDNYCIELIITLNRISKL